MAARRNGPPQTKNGLLGERYAADRLLADGWTIVARNYRTRWGEVDLIASKGDILAFVEVKTRAADAWARPAAAVDARKQRRMILTAQQYLLEHPTELQPRFDVAEVVTRSAGGFEVVEYRYLPGAFDAGGGS